jgi:hypothetical protein
MEGGLRIVSAAELGLPPLPAIAASPAAGCGPPHPRREALRVVIGGGCRAGRAAVLARAAAALSATASGGDGLSPSATSIADSGALTVDAAVGPGGAPVRVTLEQLGDGEDGGPPPGKRARHGDGRQLGSVSAAGRQAAAAGAAGSAPHLYATADVAVVLVDVTGGGGANGGGDEPHDAEDDVDGNGDSRSVRGSPPPSAGVASGPALVRRAHLDSHDAARHPWALPAFAAAAPAWAQALVLAARLPRGKRGGPGVDDDGDGGSAASVSSSASVRPLPSATAGRLAAAMALTPLGGGSAVPQTPASLASSLRSLRSWRAAHAERHGLTTPSAAPVVPPPPPPRAFTFAQFGGTSVGASDTPRVRGATGGGDEASPPAAAGSASGSPLRLRRSPEGGSSVRGWRPGEPAAADDHDVDGEPEEGGPDHAAAATAAGGGDTAWELHSHRTSLVDWLAWAGLRGSDAVDDLVAGGRLQHDRAALGGVGSGGGGRDGEWAAATLPGLLARALRKRLAAVGPGWGQEAAREKEASVTAATAAASPRGPALSGAGWLTALLTPRSSTAAAAAAAAPARAGSPTSSSALRRSVSSRPLTPAWSSRATAGGGGGGGGGGSPRSLPPGVATTRRPLPAGSPPAQPSTLSNELRIAAPPAAAAATLASTAAAATPMALSPAAAAATPVVVMRLPGQPRHRLRRSVTAAPDMEHEGPEAEEEERRRVAVVAPAAPLTLVPTAPTAAATTTTTTTTALSPRATAPPPVMTLCVDEPEGAEEEASGPKAAAPPPSPPFVPAAPPPTSRCLLPWCR